MKGAAGHDIALIPPVPSDIAFLPARRAVGVGVATVSDVFSQERALRALAVEQCATHECGGAEFALPILLCAVTRALEVPAPVANEPLLSVCHENSRDGSRSFHGRLLVKRCRATASGSQRARGAR